MHTLPNAVGKAVERTFFPLQFVLALGAELACKYNKDPCPRAWVHS
jgi:hypothetical protein